MMSAMSPPFITTDGEKQTLLSFTLSARGGGQTILSVHKDGSVVVQPTYGGPCFIGRLSAEELESQVFARLPCASFLDTVQGDYETVPSAATCGTAANLYLHHGGRDKWYGCWNYGRGELKQKPAKEMYDACVALSAELSKHAKFAAAADNDSVRDVVGRHHAPSNSVQRYGECKQFK
jgi:hypothetical protein